MKKRLVVKLGTSSLTGGAPYLKRQRMLELVQQIAHLHQKGHELILVTSGAQTAGNVRLAYPELERSVPAKQMLAAVGQSHLMRIYNDLFDIFEIVVGQILLTRDDLSNRGRYLNARDTMLTLLKHRIIPVVNENDTIATDEIRVGDNDNLSALVASALEADYLVILTDQQGLFMADPRIYPDAELVKVVEHIDTATFALAGGAGSSIGTGGMVTKIQAAQTASRSGITTVIARSAEPNVLERILNGEQVGTRFAPVVSLLESRKRWLLIERTQGAVYIDAGAERVLLKGGASLLPVGIKRVSGEFDRGATVSICNIDQKEIGHGLSRYSSAALRQICGKQSSMIPEILGYSYGDEVIHRNDLVLLR